MLNISQQLQLLNDQFEVLTVIDLDYWTNTNYEHSKYQLIDQCTKLYQPEYKDNQRIVFTYTRDYYVDGADSVGILLKNLQVILNEQDISNFFVVVLSTNPNLTQEMIEVAKISADPVPVTGIQCVGEFQSEGLKNHPYSTKEIYQYGSANPIKINLNDISERNKFLLSESKTFCILPWIHLHAYPTGDAYPCCHAEMGIGKIGSCRTNTLEELWNSDAMKQLRTDITSETHNDTCRRCYEQETAGFFSGRQSANKHHGHHIERVQQTQPDGTYDDFKLTYWDIRFSNLCNLSCRSCGYIFSSNWYQDQAKLAGGDWKSKNPVMNYAGRTETDMWEQLEPHLDYVEQIYFAGGEPLLMEEHYRILDELVRRERFDVRLVYNTNFTHTDLKGKSVFEYWKLFDSVSVGASLDAMGPRGEYIRKGTDWPVVEQNRRDMLAICPDVNFYISATLSIMNALHLPDFHRDWVEKGLLQPQDLNVNILQDPPFYRIDIAPESYKQQIREKFEAHLEWLRPQDHLRRATVGLESAINFMMATDKSVLIPKFWARTQQLDDIRRENILDILPELEALK